jgi:hypothetical protein
MSTFRVKIQEKECKVRKRWAAYGFVDDDQNQDQDERVEAR